MNFSALGVTGDIERNLIRERLIVGQQKSKSSEMK
jgi:hypothetical protein